MKIQKIMTASFLTTMMIVSSVSPAFAYMKDETVYTKLDENGKKKITIVSEHLKNDKDEETLHDLSTLSNILNVNGDEKMVQDGKQLTWEAKGNDIYYQGKTDKELPISMNITYKLNGKPATVEQMLKKSGKVEIHIQYTNHIKKKNLYVPFVVATGLMLPTDKNSDVEVTHGKVVSNGSNHVVVGLSTPGLYEDFNNNKNLKGFDEITITYQTKSFELKSMMAVASPSVLSDDDMKIFDKMNDMDSMMKELTSSYALLQKGGEDLNKGVQEFSSKYNEFDKGIAVLCGGIQSAVNGANALNSGLNTISQGLNELDSHSSELTTGAKQTFQVLLATATNQIKPQLQTAGLSIPDLTIANYHKVLNNVLQEIAGATTLKVTQAVKEEVTKQVTTIVDQNVEASVTAALKENDAQVREEFKQQLILKLVESGKNQAEVETCLATNEGKAMLEKEYQSYLPLLKEKKIAEQKQSQTYKEAIANNVQEQMNSQAIQNKIQQLVSENTTGQKATAYMQVYNLQVQLDTFNTFYTGIQQYTQSVGQIKEGTKQALEGSKQLTNGLNELQSGANLISNSSSKLNEATKSLKAGANQLSSGMVEFNEKGLSQLSDVVENLLKKNVHKTKELIKLANEYQTFTEVNKDVEATTKFIMIVDGKTK